MTWALAALAILVVVRLLDSRWPRPHGPDEQGGPWVPVSHLRHRPRKLHRRRCDCGACVAKEHET